MKSMKKILGLLLILVMLFSITACGADGSSAPETSGEETAGTEDTPSDSTEEPEPSSGDRVKLTMFVDESWWPYSDWTGAIPEEFNKRAGVEIETQRAADDNQLSLMVASGDMTDLVCSYRYQYMADSNVSYALDTLQEEYPEVDFQVHSVTQFVNTAADGHFYTIGVGYSPDSEYANYDKILSEGTGFMVREDILDELGMSIESLEDLDTVFAAVSEAYPEMNTVVFNYIHKFGWLRTMMGVPGNKYYDNNGELEWYIRHEGQLDYYQKINEWYRLGYIPSECFAFQTEDETEELVVAGRAFANFGYDNHADNFNTAIAANGDDYRMKLITDVISDSAKKYDIHAGGRGLYITKSCDNVETAFKTLAYAYGEEGMRLLMWGIDGEDYSLDNDGYPIFEYDFQGDNTVLEPRGLKYWGWIVHDAIVTGIAEVNMDSQTAAARTAITPYVERNPVIGMIRFETDSDEAVINAKLDELIKNEEINILMADSAEACIAAYNAMVEKAESVGLSDIEQYGNDTYETLRTEYDKIAANEE